MDFTLRCNSLKCRNQLNDRAVVTTCSHVFCIACSNDLGLSSANTAVRVCPACNTHLSNPDDAVETCLDPTEDYKTSVLSGLSPSIIMECAGRGLAFYSYQTTQEIMYQEYLGKSLTEKYTVLNGQMDKVVHDANAEIAGLRDKLQAVQLEQKRLEEENHKIAEAYREKARSQASLQKVYTQLKAQVLVGQVATAASEDAEATLQSATCDRYVDRLGARSGPQPGYPSDRNGNFLPRHRRSDGSNGNGEAWRGGQPADAWGNQAPNNRLFNNHSAPIAATPSHHRTRLGDMNTQNRSQVFHPVGSNGPSDTPMARQPLSNLNPNSFSAAGLSGYGMSAGMRAGKHMSGSAVGRGDWRNRAPGHQNSGLR